MVFRDKIIIDFMFIPWYDCCWTFRLFLITVQILNINFKTFKCRNFKTLFLHLSWLSTSIFCWSRGKIQPLLQSMLSPVSTWLPPCCLQIFTQVSPLEWGLSLALPVHISALFNSIALVSYWISYFLNFDYYWCLSTWTSAPHEQRSFFSSVSQDWRFAAYIAFVTDHPQQRWGGGNICCWRYWEKKACVAEAYRAIVSKLRRR